MLRFGMLGLCFSDLKAADADHRREQNCIKSHKDDYTTGGLKTTSTFLGNSVLSVRYRQQP